MTAEGSRSAAQTEDAATLEPLLEYLKTARGFDFTSYKRSSLERRIRKRMDEVGIERYEEYQDQLEVNPDEFTELFNSILINVTSFFRDEAAWDYVAGEVIPQVLRGVPEQEPIRVWSAGCASGEEAYTLAILLAEALGEEAFRRRVKIYATDVDEVALARARQATYPSDALNPVPDEYQASYFERTPLGWTFRGDLRRAVIFGRNDLVQDAPISRIDLLVSRNALMYFTPEAQARIVGHFNFALKESGFLFLGRSEMLIAHSDLFTPYEVKWRVFKKVPRGGLSERLASLAAGRTVDRENPERQAELRNAVLDVAPVAQVVVDRSGFIMSINQLARALFEIGPTDIGRPLRDLELSYRPGDLRSALEQAFDEGGSVRIGRVAWTPPAANPVTLEVVVTPITGGGSKPLGATISFEDVTATTLLREEHEHSQRQLETAYEELQSTVEELETTNEELHSTNEELETTNEELQSSNEELETMNEELQSTNDELEAMNEEQASRSAELDRVNLFLEGILGSMGVGVVVLDKEQRVQIWNANSADLWGLRAEEVEGRHLLELDIGLPVERLKDPIRQVLAGDQERSERELEALTRRGRTVPCRVRVMPLRTSSDELYGVILLMAADGQALGGS